MPLPTHVQDRYGAQYLINLTNPFNPAAVTLDSARLTKAATDVQADFEIYVGVVYDDVNNLHISTAVQGVIDKLILYSGQGDTRELVAQHVERLRALARVTGRDRILPKGTSILVPSSEQRGTSPVRPDYDRRRFDAIQPESPALGERLVEID